VFISTGCDAIVVVWRKLFTTLSLVFFRDKILTIFNYFTLEEITTKCTSTIFLYSPYSYVNLLTKYLIHSPLHGVKFQLGNCFLLLSKDK